MLIPHGRGDSLSGLSQPRCAVDDPLRHGLPVAGFLPKLGHPYQVAFFALPVRGALALGLAHH